MNIPKHSACRCCVHDFDIWVPVYLFMYVSNLIYSNIYSNICIYKYIYIYMHT